MERLQTDGKEKLRTIEGVKELFADPTGERTTESIRLSGRALRVMQEIYKTEGVIDKMPGDIQVWLNNSKQKDVVGDNGLGDIDLVLGQILEREAHTRRFDHKFFGQIHPQGNEIAIISDLIAAYMNTNTVYNKVSVSENIMEMETLDWLANMFGYDQEKFSGNIVTDGTEANETGFWVAREWMKSQLVEENKDPQNTKLYVLGSEAKHYSIVKICNKLNLEFVEIPQVGLKTGVEAMRKRINELDLNNGRIAIILGIAGGTETGMVDDLLGLSKIAKDNKAHFHVDAAYGGPYILSKESSRFLGISEADSITIDPHKMLYTPYEAGVILIKDKDRHALITKCFLQNAGYLVNSDAEEKKDPMAKSRSYGGSRPSGSLGAGGAISTWATMKLLGNEGIKTLLTHTLKLTDYAYTYISKSKTLTPLCAPELNTMLFCLKNIGDIDQSTNNSIVDKAIMHAAEFGYYISSDDEISHKTKIFRFVAMHPYSTEEHVGKLMSLLEESISKPVGN
jgi:glutamate/tyrosine decarboxylase-like PLP-dependent enzyme